MNILQALSGLLQPARIEAPSAARPGADAGHLTVADCRDGYVRALAEEGYRPVVDERGYVTFKAEGLNYVLAVDERDLEFLNLVMPHIWPIESPEEWGRAVTAAATATAEIKLAKVLVTSETVHVAVELICPPGAAPMRYLGRSIRVMQYAGARFAELMRAEAPAQHVN
jgi:hypothetical protein